MTIRGNHLYDHLGVRSKRVDDECGETRMPVNDDVRVSGGLRAAPLGLAFEQGVASYLFAKVMAVPSQISLHIRDQGAGVNGVVSTTRLVRLGRTLATVEGRIVDDTNPSRLLTYGSIAWSVIGEAAWPPVGRRAPAGTVARSRCRRHRGSRHHAPLRRLQLPGGGHHRPDDRPRRDPPRRMFQLLCEEAALVAARTATGIAKGRAVDCTFNFMQPGKTGPFVATAEILCTGEEGVDTTVIVRDVGNNNRIPALAHVRVRPVG